MVFGIVLFFGMPGGTEWIVIAILIVVLLFGAAKIPQLAKSFGQAMGEFKKAKREAELNYKKFEESVTGSEEEIPKEKAKVKAAAKTKGEEVNIKEVAAYMGIDTEGKTEEELKEEVQAKMEASKSEKE